MTAENLAILGRNSRESLCCMSGRSRGT